MKPQKNKIHLNRSIENAGSNPNRFEGIDPKNGTEFDEISNGIGMETTQSLKMTNSSEPFSESIEKVYRNSDGKPYLFVSVSDCSELSFYGKTFEEFYDLKEEDNLGSAFGRFGYDIFYRLDYCLYKGSFSIRKTNTKAKLTKTYLYNLIDPSASAEGPIQHLVDNQLCGYTVHKTESHEEPHLRYFTVYATDEKELNELSTNYYQWFVDLLEQNLFGSSSVHWHWKHFSKKDPLERRQYADRFMVRYRRRLNGENVNYPIDFDTWDISESEIAELMEADQISI